MARKINQKQKSIGRQSRLNVPVRQAASPSQKLGQTSRKTLRDSGGRGGEGPDVVDALVAASAQALLLRIDPAWRASVKLTCR